MSLWITVDARMSTTAGIGTYLTELLPRVATLMDDAKFTIRGASEALTARLRDNPRVPTLAFDHPIYGVAEQVWLPRRIPRGTTLFWAPHYNVPLLYRGALAVAMHNAYPVRLPQLSALRTLYAKACSPRFGVGPHSYSATHNSQRPSFAVS